MGLISGIGNLIDKKVKEKQTRDQEEKAIQEIQRKAIIEERKRQAPELAKQLVSAELRNKVKATKEGKQGTGGILGTLQNMKTAPVFGMNNWGQGMGGQPGGQKTKQPVIKNAFDREYDQMFGSGKNKPKAKNKRSRT